MKLAAPRTRLLALLALVALPAAALGAGPSAAPPPAADSTAAEPPPDAPPATAAEPPPGAGSQPDLAPLRRRLAGAIDQPLELSSLLGAETLHGRSAALAEAGYSSLRLAYGQGLGDADDLGVEASLDWTTTEGLLGAFWRHALARGTGWNLAARLGLGWYLDLGGRYLRTGNEADRGLEAAPGIVVSSRAAGGLFSVEADLPVVVTVRRGGGLVAAPDLTFTYEAPLYEQLLLGVQGGLGWRGGAGGAPLRSGAFAPRFLVVADYRVF